MKNHILLLLLFTASLITSQSKINEKPSADSIVVNEQGDTIYYIMVEEMPAPIGGIEGIQDKIYYPETARRNGTEGKVYILALIDERGNVSETSVLKSVSKELDESAMNAIRNTKFKPGRHQGKFVKVQVAIPIVFKLR